MASEINGFKFNEMGQIISEPKTLTLDVLKETLKKANEMQEYICASRIQHKINVIELFS